MKKNVVNVVNNSFTVKELASIYKFPAYKSTSSIFILSFGGGIYGTITNNVLTNGDVQKYWKRQGITQMSSVYVYFMNGAINDISDSGSTLENTLDVSTVGSCCQSTIVLCVFPTDTLFSDAFTKMMQGVNINGTQIIPTIISVSWGMSEIQMDISDMMKTNSLLQSYNINVCVASGDFGATNGTNVLTCDFPSASPFVTAVGGTRLICPNKVYDAQTKEISWNDGISATGGGVSKLFKKPSYQSSIVGNNRMVPDISFNCDPNTGIQLYFNGNLESGIGGTSFSAPFFASCIALYGITSFINPLLYSNNCFHDITVGSNAVSRLKGYFAKKGFDLCSGLGSMDCSKFVNNPFIQLQTNITVMMGESIVVPVKMNVPVSWKSSNQNVLINNGIIKGMRIGSSSITAYSNNLYSTMIVNVIPVKNVKLVKSKVKMISMSFKIKL